MQTLRVQFLQRVRSVLQECRERVDSANVEPACVPVAMHEMLPWFYVGEADTEFGFIFFDYRFGNHACLYVCTGDLLVKLSCWCEDERVESVVRICITAPFLVVFVQEEAAFFYEPDHHVQRMSSLGFGKCHDGHVAFLFGVPVKDHGDVLDFAESTVPQKRVLNKESNFLVVSQNSKRKDRAKNRAVWGRRGADGGWSSVN